MEADPRWESCNNHENQTELNSDEIENDSEHDIELASKETEKENDNKCCPSNRGDPQTRRHQKPDVERLSHSSIGRDSWVRNPSGRQYSSQRPQHKLKMIKTQHQASPVTDVSCNDLLNSIANSVALQKKMSPRQDCFDSRGQRTDRSEHSLSASTSWKGLRLTPEYVEQLPPPPRRPPQLVPDIHIPLFAHEYEEEQRAPSDLLYESAAVMLHSAGQDFSGRRGHQRQDKYVSKSDTVRKSDDFGLFTVGSSHEPPKRTSEGPYVPASRRLRKSASDSEFSARSCQQRPQRINGRGDVPAHGRAGFTNSSTSHDGRITSEMDLVVEGNDVGRPFGQQGVLTLKQKFRQLEAWEEQMNAEENAWRARRVVIARKRQEHRAREESEFQAHVRAWDRFRYQEEALLENERRQIDTRVARRGWNMDDDAPKQQQEPEHKQAKQKEYHSKPIPPSSYGSSSSDDGYQTPDFPTTPDFPNVSKKSSPPARSNTKASRKDKAWVIDTSDWPKSEQEHEHRKRRDPDRSFKHFQLAKEMGDVQRQASEERIQRKQEQRKKINRRMQERRLQRKEEDFVQVLEERGKFQPDANPRSARILAAREKRQAEAQAIESQRALASQRVLGSEIFGGQGWLFHGSSKGWVFHDSTESPDHSQRKASASSALQKYWQDELCELANKQWTL